MRATAAPAEGNRVRLSVEVDEAEVDEALAATVRRLAQQVRVPGFRPGRVPRPVLEARFGGPSALRQQAISDALPDLYARAVADTELDPIDQPEIDITAGEESGPVHFDALVEVRPVVAIPGYGGLQVTIPSPVVSDEEVDAQVDRLRRQEAELVTVDRPAADGDQVTIDLHAERPDGEDIDVQDYLYEVGAGSDIPGLDDQLRGASPGAELTFEASLPGAAGTTAGGKGEGGEETDEGSPSAVAMAVRVVVKEIKEQVLPEATDAWAAEASEFSTLAELRDDLRRKMTEVATLRSRMLIRERALAALAELVEEEPPASLVESEVQERLHDLGHRLQSRNLTVEQFLAASGRDEASLVADLRAEAARAVVIDLALRSLAEAEAIEVTEEDLDRALAEMGEQAGLGSAEVRRRLDRAGRLPAVRSEQRKAKALEWLLEHVEVVDEDGKPVPREQMQPDEEPGEEERAGAEASAEGTGGTLRAGGGSERTTSVEVEQ